LKPTVYPPCNIHKSATIGEDTQIGAFCDIGKDVKIGKGCNIQAHVTISNGCQLGDHVFIGPNTSLLNDKHMDGVITPVNVESEAKIGGGVTILPSVTIGRGAVIGAGAIVTKDVPAHTCYISNMKERMVW